MHLFQAALDTCFDSPLLYQPLSSRFALHGLRALDFRFPCFLRFPIFLACLCDFALFSKDFYLRRSTGKGILAFFGGSLLFATKGRRVRANPRFRLVFDLFETLWPWGREVPRTRLGQKKPREVVLMLVLNRGQKKTPKIPIYQKNAVHTNFFGKFARTSPSCPVPQVRNPTDIVQRNLFRWTFYFGWIFFFFFAAFLLTVGSFWLQSSFSTYIWQFWLFSLLEHFRLQF